MLYVIMGQENPLSGAARKATRPAHLAYLKALQDQGRLVLAGPRPKADSASAPEAGYHGSLIVAEFPDLATAQAWADQDPYLRAGVFSRVLVQPFVQVLPA